MSSKVLLLFVALTVMVQADVYMQNPRGSNNRLDDQNRDRNNANRLFDSQNNNRGGHNVGSLYFLSGSELPMEWSAQHSCGTGNNNCEIVIQYMCDKRLRDGTSTNTIPIKSVECYDWDCDTDVRYGRHESLESYKSCMYRERNKGLFTSTQKLNGDGAIYTRQNPNGARRGYECPEERDYYPYWHPTQWKDVAILTNQASRCEAYAAQSQNVASRWSCEVPAEYAKLKGYKKGIIPITKEKCESVLWKPNEEQMDAGMTNMTGVWVETAAFNIPAPDCIDNAWSRDNHHGNIDGGFFTGYNWTIPEHSIHEQCAFRVRYNISTGDMPHFDGPTTLESQMLAANQSGTDKKPAKYNLAIAYGLDNETEGYKREYNIQNNPQVDMFGSLLTAKNEDDEDADQSRVRLQLAVNTAQYGRTFQDRSHRFAMRMAPPEVGGNRIHNLNVRGKRGNIVQTYPGVEYDFVPNRLHCKKGEFVHFQWTGSNTNPNNNAGQGRQGSDRSNVVGLRVANYKEWNNDATKDLGTTGQWGNSYPARVDSLPFLGLERLDMQHLAILDVDGGQFGGELSELDDAGTYFDLGPKECKEEGVYHYLCTRNNNFSNRSQKGKIVVDNVAVIGKAVGILGAMVSDPSGNVVDVPREALKNLQHVSMMMAPSTGVANTLCEEGCASDFVSVQPASFDLKDGQTVAVSVAYSADPFGYATMYRADAVDGSWTEVESSCESGVCTTQTTAGGTFAVDTTTNLYVIIPITLLAIILLAVVGVCVYKKHGGGGQLKQMENSI